MRVFILGLLLLVSTASFSQWIAVKPYLQNAEPTSIHIMWETSSDNATEVEYGLTNGLGTTITGTSATGFATSQVHDVYLTGLQPATKYFYKAKTGSLERLH